MDNKAKQIMKHYKVLFENRLFDEYDVLGFLIFIRTYLDESKFLNIKEFSHLIAHRNREWGKVNDCIVAAIKNGYQTKEDGKTVIGYNGINYNIWIDEWKKLGQEFKISFDDKIIEELTICIFSLAQFTCYNDKNGRGSGMLELFMGNDKSLALVTTEGKKDSLRIGFFKAGCCEVAREVKAGHIVNPVEAVRVDGVLRLKDSDGYII